MADVMTVDENAAGVSTPNAPHSAQKTLKRKSAAYTSDDLLTCEGRDIRLRELYAELQGLYAYYKELSDCSVTDVNWMEGGGGSHLNMSVSCLIEESSKPLTKLVDEVLEKLRSRYSASAGITMATIKSQVLTIGQRSFYGVSNPEADILEDDTASCLWCWETRDLKLIPKSIRGVVKIRRIGRKKIQHRILAISEIINVVQRIDSNQNWKNDLARVSEKLIKVLDEEDIRLLIQSVVQKNGVNLNGKEVKREEKIMTKQLEKSKVEAERERKRLDREHKKEKMQNEKEQKRLQAEAEKDEKRREKEEYETRKQLKKQQEEAGKDKRKREKEEVEWKKQLAMQKQASLMERFLKKNSGQNCHNYECSEVVVIDCQIGEREEISDSVAKSMDFTFSAADEFSIDDIRMLHVSAWRSLGGDSRKKNRHWGMRQMPKTDPFKKIKLCGAKESCRDDDPKLDKLEDSWKLHHSVEELSYTCGVNPSLLNHKSYCKQLLQFDKSHRPAFYGIRPQESQIIGPRRPLRKDPGLDYDVDSDEEWEEEDPGESLSDCDKDDEEDELEGQLKYDDNGDGSEDGFFVPDGYLSENEGVDVDRAESFPFSGDCSMSHTEQAFYGKEFCIFLQQQKYLHDLTEHALRKNQTFIVLNLKHEKTQPMTPDEIGCSKNLEYMCLQALSMVVFPGRSAIVKAEVHEDDHQEMSLSNDKASTSLTGNSAAELLDSDLPKIVSIIESSSHGINKVLESLQHAFPSIPKIQLRNKVREISSFLDNRWQVKEDILDKLGVSPSPERVARNKTIISFFSKRCLPPTVKCLGSGGSSVEPSEKSDPLSTSLAFSVD